MTETLIENTENAVIIDKRGKRDIVQVLEDNSCVIENR